MYLVMLNESPIIEQMLLDENIMGVVGILECKFSFIFFFILFSLFLDTNLLKIYR